MPRKRKTQSGEPAQPIPKSIPGVRYGEGVEQQAMTRAMPLANARDSAIPAEVMPPGSVRPNSASTGQQVSARPPVDIQSLPALMSNMPVGILNQPGSPDNPITSGLSTGPGPGPSINQPGNSTPLLRVLNNLYQSTGDPNFNRLAEKLSRR